MNLNPYEHELNSSGTDCCAECPACEWLKHFEKSPIPVRVEPDADTLRTRLKAHLQRTEDAAKAAIAAPQIQGLTFVISVHFNFAGGPTRRTDT